MKIFKDGIINNVHYWGYFEDRDITNLVIRDLNTALNANSVSKSAETSDQKYVLAFSMGSDLYVIHHGYYAVLVTKKSVWHAPRGLAIVPLPEDGVLVLSKNYVDDVPRYINALKFCRIIGHQHCIPMLYGQN